MTIGESPSVKVTALQITNNQVQEMAVVEQPKKTFADACLSPVHELEE